MKENCGCHILYNSNCSSTLAQVLPFNSCMDLAHLREPPNNAKVKAKKTSRKQSRSRGKKPTSRPDVRKEDSAPAEDDTTKDHSSKLSGPEIRASVDDPKPMPKPKKAGRNSMPQSSTNRVKVELLGDASLTDDTTKDQSSKISGPEIRVSNDDPKPMPKPKKAGRTSMRQPSTKQVEVNLLGDVTPADDTTKDRSSKISDPEIHAINDYPKPMPTPKKVGRTSMRQSSTNQEVNLLGDATLDDHQMRSHSSEEASNHIFVNVSNFT